MERAGFERFYFSIITFSYDIIKSNRLEGCQDAEVVGSTPTQSIFINLVKYGIGLSFTLTVFPSWVIWNNDDRALKLCQILPQGFSFWVAINEIIAVV